MARGAVVDALRLGLRPRRHQPGRAAKQRRLARHHRLRRITLGITTPLSGAIAGPGTCTVAGVTAYFGATNAAGGVKFGDGKTRTVDIKALRRHATTRRRRRRTTTSCKDDVFAMTAGLGTPTNRASRRGGDQPTKVPQVLVMTGDPLFSDRKQSPWQLGFVPDLPERGRRVRQAARRPRAGRTRSRSCRRTTTTARATSRASSTPSRASDNIQVVGELTYEATDTSVDAQLTELASSGADVFFNAMSMTPLAISSLQKAQQLGWKPSWFLPSNTSSPGAILDARRRRGVPRHLLGRRSPRPRQSPAFAKDPDVVEYLAALKQYGELPGPAGVPALPVELDGGRDAGPGLPEHDRARPGTAS